MLNFKSRSIAGVATLAATMMTIAIAAPVRAETRSVPVRYADLDLGTAAGKSTLDRRIDHAADIVCGASDQVNKFDVANCRSKAIASARNAARLASAQSTKGVELAGR
jgi:UrcA family protein